MCGVQLWIIFPLSVPEGTKVKDLDVTDLLGVKKYDPEEEPKPKPKTSETLCIVLCTCKVGLGNYS